MNLDGFNQIDTKCSQLYNYKKDKQYEIERRRDIEMKMQG